MPTNANRQFSRLFWKITAVAAIITALFFGLTALSGPRLRHASFDVQQAVDSPGQRLSLQANQPVKQITAAQVHIKPAVQFSVTSNASTITVTFKQRLAYGTRYELRIDDVAARHGRTPAGTFRYGFSTPDAVMYYLKRGGNFNRTDNSQDRIIRTSLAKSQKKEQETVYSARRIQEFAVVGSRLAVVTVGQDKMSSIVLVDPATGKATPVDLPATGTVDRLESSVDNTTYGFRFTENAPYESQNYRDNLFIHNTSPGRRMVPLLGLNRQPIQVADWHFAPDGASVIAQTSNASVILLDTKTPRAPLALGRYSEISSFTADGTTVSVHDRDGFSLLDIPKRKLTPLDSKSLQLDGRPALPIKVKPLSNQKGEAIQTQAVDDIGTVVSEAVIINRQQSDITAHRCKLTECLIIDYRMSPNDQYLVVEQSPSTIGYDEYPANYRHNNTRTLIKDTETGRAVRTIDGIGLQWGRYPKPSASASAPSPTAR